MWMTNLEWACAAKGMSSPLVLAPRLVPKRGFPSLPRKSIATTACPIPMAANHADTHIMECLFGRPMCIHSRSDTG